MAIGFLRDNRLDQAVKRADTAEAKVATAETKAATAEALLQQERERADRERELAGQEREHADQILTELSETRKNQDAMEARLRHSEDRIDGDSIQPDSEK